MWGARDEAQTQVCLRLKTVLGQESVGVSSSFADVPVFLIFNILSFTCSLPVSKRTSTVVA